MGRQRVFSALPHFLLLQQQLKRGASASREVIEACRSQAGLASLSIPKHKVKPVSLNTLKAAANNCPEMGGWAAMDLMRKELSGRRVTGGMNSATAREVSTPGLDSITLADEADRSRLRVERAYLALLKIARSAASRDEQLGNDLVRHMSEWGNALGLALAKHGSS